MPASAKRILIAPLDWGFGHTTRCIPIIRAITASGHQVIFAGTERQQAFIIKTFSDIDVIFLEGYRVRYSRHVLMLTILWQLPRLAALIRKEHQWLDELVKRERIDGIISDNRYGLWHPKTPCVIMTHQLNILTGLGRAADALIRRIHYRFLRRFGEIWVPDLPGADNLAGRLAHPEAMPPKTSYIGWLSQFQAPPAKAAPGSHVLILLSGPEPQRTILADKLWQQALALDEPVVFVEGKADASRAGIPAHIQYLTLADAAVLQPLMEGASVVVCRSGYSTLMDLRLVGKCAVIIPTPGQTEQEYLARYLSGRGVFYAADQKSCSLRSAIAAVRNGACQPAAERNETLLDDVLQHWLSGL